MPPFQKMSRGTKAMLRFVPLCTLILWCLVSLKSYLQLQQQQHFLTQMSPRAPPMDIGRQKGTPIILNIGSNLDPIIPRPTDDPCMVAIAFEPIVGHKIPPHPALHVIHAAVSDVGGLSVMNLYNKNGLSSSLSKASYQAKWNRKSNIQIVPTIAFRTVLESLEHYDIQMIMTDMQGYDFKAVSSVGNYLAQVGVKRLVTEVYRNNVSTYKGAHNDLCRDWLPHMTSIGYVFEGLRVMRRNTMIFLEGYRNAQEVIETCKKEMKEHPVETAGEDEYNAYWRLKSEPVPASLGKEGADSIDPYLFGTHWYKYPGPVFSDQQYEQCTMSNYSA